MFEYLVIRECYYLTEIRRCGLVVVDMVLLEEVCHWVLGFGVWNAQARPSDSLSSCSLLDPDVEFSATSPEPSLLICHFASCHDNGLNL